MYENLIGFLAVTETTGEYLTNAVLGELEKNGLDEGWADFYMVRSTCMFFKVLWSTQWRRCANAGKLSKIKLTIEPLLDARWKSRIVAVKAALLQFDHVECIENLKNETELSDTLSQCDCVSVLNEMLSLEFIVSLHVWYELLARINTIRKLCGNLYKPIYALLLSIIYFVAGSKSIDKLDSEYAFLMLESWMRPQFHLNFLSHPSGRESFEPVNSLHCGLLPSKISGGSNTSAKALAGAPH
ncbi:DUF4371 domain-containing protein [Trichonephila clavipes]|uniref:DUF4371 domain-containing protein n=1 Tax=Trichonephila clavipes TaxID=2585209 RepID=A0A8X6VDD5_TRICX|nr:DUF4371 domain-containing protein [Trichonephila clavipes]